MVMMVKKRVIKLMVMVMLVVGILSMQMLVRV